ncbi:hypothetical protein [Halogeometricum limi]|uniref:Uncharacterized protein n=1 Tax=Halogeometricum limi TaxID=555875 RepID=A0A1I6HUY7_9EURY|nr:hypothetical protein [Halogeometricum limi]SFR58253.1 hypothetical protein SAMN04488124_2490 [Halogeometricum limi]
MSSQSIVQGPPSKYFKQDSSAFRTVVKLGKTKPGQYEKGEIKEKIEQYAALTSLGDVHTDGLANIKELLGEYKNSPAGYPEMKGYGVVGQYGDGKTHFLSQIHKLLQNEEEIVCPEGMNLLTLDPFNFTSNPADIVEALRERVKAEIGPDAAEKISDVQDDETEAVIDEFVKLGLSREEAEARFKDREVQKRQGQDAGIAFSEGCKSIVNEELYDAVVLLMDEIEGIVRGEDVSFEDLDKYREFFDEIDQETPVLMIMTAPRDQWNRFEQVHAAMMDRMFGPTPRQHVRLRPLNEEELLETWKLRREKYLVRKGVDLPEVDNSDVFPLHTTTLRAIHQIADRADSNRTAIKLMKDGYNLFFKNDETRWVSPGDIFLSTDALTAGDGGFFVRDQFNQIKKFDEMGVLSSIAATLDVGISRSELLEVLHLDENSLDDRIEHLHERGWLTRRQSGSTLKYELSGGKLDALLKEGEAETAGELKRIVENTMSNVMVDEEILYRNLCAVLQDTDPFKSELIPGSHNDDEHYFIVKSTYGDFHDRRLLVAVGNQSPEELEEIRDDQDAELVITIDYGNHNYSNQRILAIEPGSLKQNWSYEVENIEYKLEKWICGYRQLKSELPEGAHALMSGIQTKVVGHALDIDEFEFGNRVADQFTRVYPHYPGPLGRMNSNAKDAYLNAIEEGLSRAELTWEDIKEIGKADGQGSVENYMDEWVKYDLANEVQSSSIKTIELKVSKSESLILDSIKNEDDGMIHQDKLFNHMSVEGYPIPDIREFLTILEKRGKVRIEDSTIQRTSDSSYEAKIFFDGVNEVAEWLTSPEFPESFQRNVIPNRDEIVRLQGVCEDQIEQIKKHNNDGTSNPVEKLIESIQEFHEATIKAVEKFNTTDYALKLVQTSRRIEEIKESDPDTDYSSTQYFNEVNILQSKSSDLSNGARRFLEQELDADSESNVFESLQAVHDDILPEFKKIGVYNEYNDDDAVNRVLRDFSTVRPDPKAVRDAVDAIETFDTRINLSKRVVRESAKLLEKFQSLEETDLSEYDVDRDIDLSDDAAEVINLYDAAGEALISATEEIENTSFRGVSEESIDSIESTVQDAAELYENAQEKRNEVDKEIRRRTSSITDEVQEIRAHVREISSQPNWTILSQIQTASARQRAQNWRDDFSAFSETIEDAASEVLEVRPSTVYGLATIRENYEEFMSDGEKFSTFAEELKDIEEDYYQSEKENLPPGRRKEIEDIRSRPLKSKPVDRIESILNRIERISDAGEIDRVPIEERIKKMVRSRQTVTPDDIAREIPDEDFLESKSEVVSALNSLISTGDLSMGFDGQVTIK